MEKEDFVKGFKCCCCYCCDPDGEVNQALKILNETFDSCIDYLKPKETNKKSFWKRFKDWF